MSVYSKYLIAVACIGIFGIPVFMLDFNDLLWKNNKEIYWGMIALLAMIGTVLLEHKAKTIQNKLEKDDTDKKILKRNQFDDNSL